MRDLRLRVGHSMQYFQSRQNIQQYNSFSQERMDAVFPEAPGIYMWVFDFEALVGRPFEQVEPKVRAFFTQRGRLRQDKGNDPFLELEWRHARSVPGDKLEWICSEISGDSSLGRALAFSATAFQRPLYAGLSVNLRRRIREHLAGRSSTIRSELDAFQLSDCAVMWQELPGIEIDTSNLVESEEGEDEVLPDALRTFESLLIHTAQPLFNKY